MPPNIFAKNIFLARLTSQTLTTGPLIILTMFIGRIGPLTLFMLLSDEEEVSGTKYPVERIAIT